MSTDANRTESPAEETVPATATSQDETARKNPAKAVAIVVVLVLIALVFIYALSDRLAPSSSRGVVSAHVVQIAPRVAGEVVSVNVTDNAVVEAGEALFSIDQRPFELAVKQAEANLATAAQGIDASVASLVAAQAAVTQARTQLDMARTDAERTLKLEARGIVPVAQGDAARTKVADAEAQLSAARANLESARVQLGPKGAENPTILAAQAQLERAQYDLASTTVRAPHRGVVTNVTLSEGHFVNVGNPAVTFIDARGAWITVDLRENQLQLLEPGDPVRLVFDAVPGEVLDGRVQSIAWGIDIGRQEKGGLVADQSSNRWFEPARHIPVRVELEGGMENWPNKVRVGGKVHAVILTGGENNPIALLVRGLQKIRSWVSYLH